MGDEEIVSRTGQKCLVLPPWLFVCFLPSREEVSPLALAWCAVLHDTSETVLRAICLISLEF